MPGTAKAYGYVTGGGTLNTALSSSNVTAVSNPTPGKFCVSITGLSSATEGAIATPDWETDGTSIGGSPDQVAHVEWDSAGTNDPCAAGQFAFVTSLMTTASSNLTNTDTNEPFFFIVP